MNIQEQIKELKEKLAKVEGLLLAQEEANNQFPRMEEEYYTILLDGDISCYRWDGDSTDRGCLAIGNVFKTMEEAEREVEKLKLLAEIKQWRKDNDPDGLELDWQDKNQRKYTLYYDTLDARWDYCITYGMQYVSLLYFSSNDYAKEFINYFEDRLNLLLEGATDE